jgi:hypothetical protein
MIRHGRCLLVKGKSDRTIVEKWGQVNTVAWQRNWLFTCIELFSLYSSCGLAKAVPDIHPQLGLMSILLLVYRRVNSLGIH